MDTQAVALISRWITQELPSLQSFANWQVSHFGSTNAPTGQPTMDPDNDGATNVEEFMTGTDPNVREYVMHQPLTNEFLQQIDDLLAMLLPAYQQEGKSYLSIGVGCTGGRHRSVVIAEELAQRLRRHGVRTAVRHRDIDRA